MSPELPDPRARAWFAGHTYSRAEDAAALAELKRSAGLRVGVCLPALNEAATVGAICSIIGQRLMGAGGLVDELIVLASGSTDGTAEVAAAAGATIAGRHPALDRVAPGIVGKGTALWSSLATSSSDIVVWLDADTRNFGEHFVTRLVGPLLRDHDLKLVKAFYERPLVAPDGSLAPGGGRVTELTVRPMLNLFYPSLAGVIQPLAGECAVRRVPLLELPLVAGYGVEVALLIDLVERWGVNALAQADLGVRIHRNRDLEELTRMAFEVLRTMVIKFEDLGLLKAAEPLAGTLAQFRGKAARVSAECDVLQLPPVGEVLR